MYKTPQKKEPSKKIPVSTTTVRFQPNQQISVTEQGEDRTAVLECVLPPDFKNVTHGIVTFIIGTATSPPYSFPSRTSDRIRFERGRLFITIWPELTVQRFLRLIVTGHAPGMKQVITPLSELLRFPAGCSTGPPLNAMEEFAARFEELYNGLLEHFGELTANSHIHIDQLILDALGGEPGGALTYEGKALATEEALQGAITAPLSNATIDLLINQAQQGLQ